MKLYARCYRCLAFAPAVAFKSTYATHWMAPKTWGSFAAPGADEGEAVCPGCIAGWMGSVAIEPESTPAEEQPRAAPSESK